MASITWRSARDCLAETVQILDLISGTLAKIAPDASITMKTGIGEASEPYMRHRGASSTTPQKRNPVSCELIDAASKTFRQHAGLMPDAMAHDFGMRQDLGAVKTPPNPIQRSAREASEDAVPTAERRWRVAPRRRDPNNPRWRLTDRRLSAVAPQSVGSPRRRGSSRTIGRLVEQTEHLPSEPPENGLGSRQPFEGDSDGPRPQAEGERKQRSQSNGGNPPPLPRPARIAGLSCPSSTWRSPA